MIRMGSQGFTLTEVLIVLVILGIISGVAASSLASALRKSREVRLIATLSAIQKASDRFYLSSQRYPTVGEMEGSWFGAPLDWFSRDPEGQPFAGGYLRSVPSQDPFQYGLKPEDGAVLHFGVTPSGLVFATQVAPGTR